MRTLFDKTSIQTMSLKNRFFKAAVYECMATETGHLTPALWELYESLAKGGVGTIFTGYAHVIREEQPNPCMLGIYEDSFIEEYQPFTDMIHQHGANVIMQIVYGGSATQLEPPSAHIWGPSAVKNDTTGITPVEMTKEDITQLTRAFASAAGRVKAAGFDGVTLHAAHGYLLSQFLCPRFNVRADEYGGSIENRARIILEIYDAVREEVGADFPVMIKINSEDFMEDGLTQTDSIIVVKMLSEKGLDAVEVSGGNYSSRKVLEGDLGASRTQIASCKDRESYFKAYAASLAEEVPIPVILTGGNRHYDVMENILNTTKISYFALARPFISEPELINIWSAGDMRVPKCVSCNQCFNPSGTRCILNQKK